MLFQELTVPTSGTQGDLGQQSILAADSLDNFQQALNQQVSSSQVLLYVAHYTLTEIIKSV